MEKHFCVTVYIIKKNKVLLIDHKKLGKWLPPGGHVETNESPADAAKREVREETGLEINFIPNMLTTSWGIQHNLINKDHEHFDIIYAAKPVTQKTKLNTKETNGLKWFALKEINKKGFRTFAKTKKWCNFFIGKNEKTTS